MFSVFELGFQVEGDALIAPDGSVYCEVINSHGATNDEMYDAGYTPIDLERDQWIHEVDSRDILATKK